MHTYSLTKEEVDAMLAGLSSPFSLCGGGVSKLAFISSTAFRYWLGLDMEVRRWYVFIGEIWREKKGKA
jgi:hypothetical protein